MGNSSSSSRSSIDFDPSAMISKPIRPQAITSSARSRRLSVRNDMRSTDHSFLRPPSSGNHRRSRSANASLASSRTPEAPPPYSAVPPVAPALGSRHTQVFTTSSRSSRPVRSNTYLRAPMRQASVEDALETLKKYNTVIIVDDSGSMRGSLWNEARDALASLADTAGRYDADGIDVYFLNNTKIGTNMKNAAQVKQLFDSVRPRGITPIGEKLEELLLHYLLLIERVQDDPTALKEIKPVNYIVLSDGSPTDDPESVIVAAARRLDAGHFPMTQVGIQFVQIGDSRKATAYLQELDDALSGNYGIRDIVDTTPYTGGRLTAEMLTKILLGGINRRVDHRGAESVMD